MSEALRAPKIGVEDYLEGEKIADVRHEYVTGDVYAMTGARKGHNRLTKRLARMVAQDTLRVEVYRRRSNWDLEVYGAGQSFDLDSIGGTLAVDALYGDIDAKS